MSTSRPSIDHHHLCERELAMERHQPSMNNTTRFVPRLEEVRARSSLISEGSESKKLEQDESRLVGEISHVLEIEKEREVGKPSVVNSHAQDSIIRSEKKRLFVCCDGTWKNASGTFDPLTNVGILARCVERIGHNRFDIRNQESGLNIPDERLNFVHQVVYYSSGVGTQSSLSVDSSIAGATGHGVTANILSAYCFICNNYNFGSEKDELIFVGFSRGAFTVRCLAAFIGEIGLLNRRGLPFLRLLFDHWRRHETKQLQESAEALAPFRNSNIRIKVFAEWDPVSAMGLPFGSRKQDLSFVNEKVPHVVDNAFVALALDEKRPSFKPLMWTKSHQNTTVKQCAFVGCHSDIGGGHPDAGLSTASLLWMVSQISTACDAQFDWAALIQFPTPLPTSLLVDGRAVEPRKSRKFFIKNLALGEGRFHESLAGWWLIPKYLSLGLWRGERHAMLEQLAQVEHQQQQVQHQHQSEEETFDSCSLTIHFTARLLGGSRECVLFRRYKPNTETTPVRWLQRELGTNSEKRGATSFLVEENITPTEKDLLLKWARTAVYWWLYDTTAELKGPGGVRDGDGVDWSSVIKNLGLHYESGSGMEKSLIKFIREELKDQKQLGLLADLF